MLKQRPLYVQIISQLGLLTAEEKIDLKNRLTILVKGVPVQITRNEGFLLDALRRELNRRGRWPSGEGNWPTKIVSGSATKLQTMMRELVKRTGQDQVSPEVQARLAKLAALCLAEYLIERKVELTPRHLLQNLNNVLFAIDESFPGYMANNLLLAIVDQEGFFK